MPLLPKDHALHAPADRFDDATSILATLGIDAGCSSTPRRRAPSRWPHGSHASPAGRTRTSRRSLRARARTCRYTSHSPASSRGTRSSSSRSVIPQSTWPSTSMPSTSSGSVKWLDVNGSRRRCGAVAEILDGGREQLHDLVGLEPPRDVRRDAPEKRVDAKAGGHRLERIERCQDLDLRRREPDLLLGLPKRGREEGPVAGSGRPPGNPSWPPWTPRSVRRRSRMRSTSVRVPEDGRQHGGVLRARRRRQTSAAEQVVDVSRRRISRASPSRTSTAAGRVTPL